jgi:DNA (cytosine-5)-methyltransferase 1
VSVYYNEIDPFAAAWLRELMKAHQIPEGVVDERSIADVQPEDVRGFTQCHFFAGIGGWAYALDLAGWGDRPVWTGSCPCQPFSTAGKRQGVKDVRHLWPHWARLIRECRPFTVFGEQVESAIAHGWLDAVFDDLEREGYACGAVCLPAASVGAPHLRQRVWFVAQSECEKRSGRDGHELSGFGTPDAERQSDPARQPSVPRLVADALRDKRRQVGAERDGSGEGSRTEGLEQRSLHVSPWSDLDWLPCRDGKYRPTESGLFPLAHGLPARVGRLRGYGNAIVPQVAAEVVKAFMELTL